jgi:hypothetical protein
MMSINQKKTHFENPFENTCSDCGSPIAKGGKIYAENIDQITCGQGLCGKCAGVKPDVAPKADQPKEKASPEK